MYQQQISRLGIHGDHWSPAELAGRLEGLDVRWCVVGGWALELAGVIPGRPHSDLEIAVPQFEFDRLKDWLAPYEFFVIGPDGMWPADGAGGAYFDNPQTFVLDPEAGVWRADVIRSQYDGDTWVFQFDRSIRRAYVDAVAFTADGIPYLRPELVLLYKAVLLGERNQADFDASVDALGAAARRCLADSLNDVAGPGHPWLAQLLH